MDLLTREEILQATDLPFENVPVPEWGGMVRVRGMTGAERDQFEGECVEQRGKQTRINYQNLRARLVARTVINGDGSRLFSDGDVQALGQKSAAALDRVFSVAQRLSGISDRDVEELTKNSPGGPSGDSTSD